MTITIIMYLMVKHYLWMDARNTKRVVGALPALRLRVRMEIKERHKGK